MILKLGKPVVPATPATSILKPTAPAVIVRKPAITIEGFTTADKIDTGGYVLNGYGAEGSGKSRFGLSLPKPMIIICMDMKTMRLIQKEIEERPDLDPSQILVTRNLSRQEGLESTKMSATRAEDIENDPELKASMVLYRGHVEATKQLIVRAAKHPAIRSGMIDSGTILFEDIMYANFGRTTKIDPKIRGGANREFMDILQLFSNARTATGRRKHLYLTGRSNSVWANNKDTGDTRAEGCTKMGYFVQDVIEFISMPEIAALRSSILSSLVVRTAGTARPVTMASKMKYYINLKKSLRRPSIAGANGVARLIDDEINYQTLMSQIYSDMDPSEFI